MKGVATMKRNRFSEEKIIGILKEYDSGVSIADLARRHGVSGNSIYTLEGQVWWYGGQGILDTTKVARSALQNAASL